MSAPCCCFRRGAHFYNTTPTRPSCQSFRCGGSIFLPKFKCQASYAVSTWSPQTHATNEHPREYSQLRRGTQLQQSSERRAVVSRARKSSRPDPKAKEDGLPSSLYVEMGKLPPNGKSLTDEEASCNPEEHRCTTPVHIWEKKCKACYGLGQVSSRSRRGHRSSYTCLACHGLGVVRRASSTQIPDFENGAMSVARGEREDTSK